MPRSRSCLSLALALLAWGATPAPAQEPSSPTQRAIASWLALEAPTGHEARATTPLLTALDGWERDVAGNLLRRVGSGRPRRVIACALDRPGFAVTQITARGLLRVHRVGGGGHPLFDQAHEGQQVNVMTARGNVPGVFAIANGHFAAQHRGDTAVVTADDLWLDIGVESADEAAALGVALLDPVERRVPAWAYAGGVAGNAVGLRGGCAAIAAAARHRVTDGETIYVMSTQSVFGWPGLSAALSRLGAIDEVTVLAAGSDARRLVWQEAVARGIGGLDEAVYRVARQDSVRIVAPAVRFAGTLVETLADSEAEWLHGEVLRSAHAAESRGLAAWIEAPATNTVTISSTAGDASLTATAVMLTRLADLPGVPGDERRVRDAIRDALPAWAKALARTDATGNLIVAAGPERDTIVFIAHMDEVAWDVTDIAPDGTLSLRARGGVIPSAWEGQPALLHPQRRDGAAPLPSLAGVFVPRVSASSRRPRSLTAWFGLDSAALVARGVRVGDGVTAYKQATRLAGTRLTARALDDRAGSTALLQAVQRLQPSQLKRRVLFVWSTGEEIGLVGAGALAADLGPSVRHVHSIDTFVSSDTPLETPHFAFAPLGDGPVLRGIENSSMVPPAMRDTVLRIARTAGIPLQRGLTQGGTDGTEFTFWGAPNVPLSWPGRYSHSPAEVLDLRDVQRLSALIEALARH